MESDFNIEKERLKKRNIEIAQLYMIGVPQTEIGRKYNITHTRVSQILVKQGIAISQQLVMNKRLKALATFKNYEEKRIARGITADKIKQLLAEGLLQKQVAAVLGCSAKTIYKFRKKNNITIKRHSGVITKQILILMMQGKKNIEISRLLNRTSEGERVYLSDIRERVRNNRHISQELLVECAQEANVPFDEAIREVSKKRYGKR